MTVLPKLTVQNKHQRMIFAEWAQNNEVSFKNVWFFDKAHYHMDGVVNKLNVRFWASEYPRVIHEKVHHATRITVWVATSSHGLPGPIFFEETVNICTIRLCLTFLPQVFHYKLSGSCRMEQGRTQRMLFRAFCMTLSTCVSSQTDCLIISNVERTGPWTVLI
jgi:hypothetical protein